MVIDTRRWTTEPIPQRPKKRKGWQQRVELVSPEIVWEPPDTLGMPFQNTEKRGVNSPAQSVGTGQGPIRDDYAQEGMPTDDALQQAIDDYDRRRRADEEAQQQIMQVEPPPTQTVQPTSVPDQLWEDYGDTQERSQGGPEPLRGLGGISDYTEEDLQQWQPPDKKPESIMGPVPDVVQRAGRGEPVNPLEWLGAVNPQETTTAQLERLGVPGHEDAGTTIKPLEVLSNANPGFKVLTEGLGFNPEIDVGPRELAGAAAGMTLPVPGGPSAKAGQQVGAKLPISLIQAAGSAGPTAEAFLKMRAQAAKPAQHVLNPLERVDRLLYDNRAVAKALEGEAVREARRLGNPIAGEFVAQQRLDPTIATEVNASEVLKPALVGLDPNLPADQSMYKALDMVLTLRANVEAARMLGVKTIRELLDKADNISLTPSLQQKINTATRRVSAYDHHIQVQTDAGNLDKVTDFTERQKAAQEQLRKLTEQADAYRQQKAKQITEGAANASYLKELARKFPGGLDVLKSEELLANIQRNLPKPVWDDLERRAAQVYRARDQMLREPLHRSGIWSQEQYDLFTQQYPHWMPTDVIKYLPDAGSTGRGAYSGSVPTQLIKAMTAEGTEAASLDTLQALMRRAFITARKARDNDAFVSFVRDIWEYGPTAKQFPKAVQYGKAELAAMKQADPMVAREARQAMAKVNNLVQHKPDEYKLYEGWVDGQNVHFAIPTPYKELIEAPDPLFATPGWAQIPNKIAHFGIVKNSPLWSLKALSVDLLEAGLRSAVRQSGEGITNKTPLVGQIPALARYYANVGMVARDVFRGMGSGTYHGIAAEYLKGPQGYAGGGMFGHIRTRPEDAADYINQLTKDNVAVFRNKREFLDLLKNIVKFEPVAALNERLDLLPRVAEYRVDLTYGSLKNVGGRMQPAPGSKLSAVTRGRTITLDFAQGGVLSKALSPLLLFFNPAMQSQRAFYQMYKENPQAFAATLVGFMGLAEFGIDAWNRADPEREAAYDSLPQYVKDGGIPIILPVKGTDEFGGTKYEAFVVPMRQFKPFHIAIRGALDASRGENPRDWTNFAMAFVNSLSPVQASSGQDVLIGFFPAVLQEPTEQIVNRDTFTGRSIDTQQTREQAGVVGKTVQAVTGVPAPRVEHALKTAGGGYAQAVMGGADLLFGGPEKRPDLNRPQAWPLVGGVIGQFVKDTSGIVSQQDIRDRTKPFFNTQNPQQAADQLNEWKAQNYTDQRAALLASAPVMQHSRIMDGLQALDEAARTMRDAYLQQFAPDELDRAKKNKLLEQMYGGRARAATLGTTIDLPKSANVADAVAAYQNVPAQFTTKAKQDQYRSEQVQEFARKWKVEPEVVRDAIKAAMNNQTVQPLGISEAQMQDAMTRYLAPRVMLDKRGNPVYDKPRIDPMTGQPAVNAQGKPLPPDRDRQLFHEAQRAEVAQIAKEYGVPADVLMDRMQLRFQKIDADPLERSMDRAFNVWADMQDPAKFPRYIDPVTDQPMFSSPSEQKEIAAIMDGIKGPIRDPVLRQIRDAENYAKLKALDWLTRQPEYRDYQTWFGPGRNMSPQDWERYTTGQLPRYMDTNDPREAEIRDLAQKYYALLPRGDALKNQLRPLVTQYRRLATKEWKSIIAQDEILRTADDLSALDQMMQGRIAP